MRGGTRAAGSRRQSLKVVHCREEKGAQGSCRWVGGDVRRAGAGTYEDVSRSSALPHTPRSAATVHGACFHAFTTLK